MCIDADEKHQQIKTSEDIKQDANAQHPMEDTPEETTPIQSEQLHALPTSTDEVTIPTEKVGCILLTSHLKQFLGRVSFVFRKTSFLRYTPHAIIVRSIFV